MYSIMGPRRFPKSKWLSVYQKKFEFSQNFGMENFENSNFG
jgi:hypothetical protein